MCRQVLDTAFYVICQAFLLYLVSMLEKLLDDVVAEDVHHDLKGTWKNFPKDLLFIVTIRCLESFLNHSRTVLIATEFDNVVVYFLPKSALFKRLLNHSYL